MSFKVEFLFLEWWSTQIIAPDDRKDWSQKQADMDSLSEQIYEIIRLKSEKAFIAGYEAAKK